MVNYEKLYAALCGAASEALDLLPDTPETAAARHCLEGALEETEETYIRNCGEAPKEN